VCRREEIPLIFQCPEHHKAWINEADVPAKLNDGDIEKIANRVVKTLKEDEDLDRIALKVRATFVKDDWKILANQVLKSLHIVHDIDVISKALLGLWRFWLILLLSLVAIYFLLREVVGDAAKEEARVQFNKEVSKQIAVQFENQRISNLVAFTASTQASNLLQNAISPQITNFVVTLQTKMKAIESNEMAFQTQFEQLKNSFDSAEQFLRRLRRTIPAEKKEAGIAMLKTLPKTTINIRCVGNTPEAYAFAQEVEDLFKRSDFKTLISFEALSVFPTPLGEKIVVNAATNAPAASGQIQAFLNSLGFHFVGEENPALTNQIELQIWNKGPL
jgi:hypothetical protein